MRRWFVTIAALVLAAAYPAAAAPLDPQLQQQLLAVYDSYNKAISAGKLQAALALRSSAVQAEIKKEMKTPQDQKDMLQMAKMMIPDTIVVRHATISAAGSKVSVIAVVEKTIPMDQKEPGGPAPGSKVRAEMTLGFVKEGGAWKYGDQLFGDDPGALVACKDDRLEPASAYDQAKTISMGGPIIRVDFQPDHTLLLVRVVDEADCVLLPSKSELMKRGVDPTKLVPYAIVALQGSPHKSEKQKVTATSVTVQPDE